MNAIRLIIKNNKDNIQELSPQNYSQVSNEEELEILMDLCIKTNKASISLNYVPVENVSSKEHPMGNVLIGIAISTGVTKAKYISVE